MSPEQKRKYNTFFGSAFVGTGIIAWLLALYFAVTPNPPAPAPVIGVPSVDLASCQAALSQMGYSASLRGQDITAYEPLGTSPKEQMEKASSAVLVCKLPLKSFCMGEGCEQPGLTFVVRKAMDRETAAKALDAQAPREAGAAASATGGNSAPRPGTPPNAGPNGSPSASPAAGPAPAAK